MRPSAAGLCAAVRIPFFDRRVDVEHAVVVTPLQDCARVDVPREVDQQVARAEMFRRSTPMFSGVMRARRYRAPAASVSGIFDAGLRILTVSLRSPCRGGATATAEGTATPIHNRARAHGGKRRRNCGIFTERRRARADSISGRAWARETPRRGRTGGGSS